MTGQDDLPPDDDPPVKEPRRVDVRLLVPALTAWCVVAAVLGWSAGRLLLLAAVCGAGGAVPLALRRLRELDRTWPALTGLTLLVTSLAILAASAHTATRTAGPIPQLARERAVVRLEGTVATDPKVVRHPQQQFVEEAGSRRAPLVLVRLRVDTVVARGERSGPRTPVLVFADESWADLSWHQHVRAVGRLDVAEPGDDVVAVLNPRGPPVVVGDAGPAERAAEHVRAGLRDAVSGLPADARGLLPGLVIGDTSWTPPDLTDAMLATGLSHLVAVSGSNVAVIVTAAMLLCRGVGPFYVPRRWRPVVAGLALAGFIVLARPEPSVLRAGVMGAIGLLGLSASRRRAGVPALAGAVIVLLCVDPWLARSYGFALSTLATLGLLLFARSWGDAIGRRLPKRISSWGDALAIPIAAQVMCGPVVVLLQGSVTVIGIVANLAAAPLVAPATVLGVTVALVALVAQPVAMVLGWVAAVPTLGIAWVGRTCAAVPWGQLPWPDGGAGALLLAAVSLAVVLTGRWWVVQLHRRPLAVGCAAVLLVALLWPTPRLAWPPPGWRFVACDVGQGDGLVLATPHGHAVVVDAGTEPAVMDACLDRLHVGVVDAVVLTHFHADHAGGLPGVLDGREVGVVYVSPVADPPQMAEAVHTWAAAAHVPVRPLRTGATLAWGPVRARVLWPTRRIDEGSVPNNASVVLAVDTHGLRLLLTGDIEREAAGQVRQELAGDPAYRQFDVLKVAHHGSSNQDSALVALTGADLAVISVGEDNDYGHPAPATLRMLRHDGMRVVRTDQSGDVAVLGRHGDVEVATAR
ncbi:MAG TPA: ComEC/Rec2 family competence protein [Segeticoccus sp.]|uniref:ComEC/Rec2 family competence protein n=1 Tax=Segeticoccus sp. TaxID=2706531 RepID=UPI002D7E2B2D|nr:ComEC/Rec2 family competence protein [Segeticoccus sp.]HET8602165.1 ComEC/Rec2 family competence protein [Segeticoccus sp.]